MASRLTADAGYPDVAATLVMLAAGLALVMPSATESIMGSLPRAKAGVGSAVNDTTRQVGGALGVAVMGSVMSSTYGPRVTDAISGFAVPEEQATAIHDQIGAAMHAASEIGGEPGRRLADVASRGFVDGMSTAFVIGAAALALGALIVLRFLPARARNHDMEASEPRATSAPSATVRPAVTVQAAGQPPKAIQEYAGRLASGDETISIAVMRSPAGWTEPAQVPEFRERTLVLEGRLVAHLEDRSIEVPAGQSIDIPVGVSVRYETPEPTVYVAVCTPAFSVDLVHRADEPRAQPAQPMPSSNRS